MIRQPSSMSRLYAWHRAALANPATPRSENEIHCGWYKMRHVKGGPWVAASVFVERETDPDTGELVADEVLVMEIEGIRQDNPCQRWTYLKPISKAAYDHLVDYRLRDSRMLDTRTPIDLSEIPTLPQGAY